MSTSTAAFVGVTLTGPTDRQPSPLNSMSDFELQHGGSADLVYADGTRTPNFMWHAARAFFANGGERLYVARVSRKDARPPDPVDFSAALKHLEAVREIAIVAAPGSTFGPQQARQRDIQSKIQTLLAHVEMRYRFAIVDSADKQSAADVRAMRATIDSSKAALYYPWVRAVDPKTGEDLLLPPSGFIAGVYAHVDLTRGVHKAPADEALMQATGLEREISSSDLEALDEQGINCLRRVPERGLIVRGARTLSSDPEWKYVNVRRLVIFLEDSIDRGLQWVVFEPNGEQLWGNVRRAVEDFLLTQWQAGALLGSRPEEAFFVRCDRSTMTQNDLDNGRLICLVGVAPVQPAEFVIFRIGQWTADRKP